MSWLCLYALCAICLWINAITTRDYLPSTFIVFERKQTHLRAISPKFVKLAPKHSGWINTSTAGKRKNIYFSLGVKLSYHWLQNTFISECGKMSCFAWLLVSTPAPTFHHMFAQHNKRQLNWFKGHLLPWKLRVNLPNASSSSFFFFWTEFFLFGLLEDTTPN